MKRYQLDPAKPRQLTSDEARRLGKTRIDYSDIPPLGDDFFSQVTRAWPTTKQQVTLRLDADVLSWLKEYAKGYQTRINCILRTAMDSQSPHRISTLHVRKKLSGEEKRVVRQLKA